MCSTAGRPPNCFVLISTLPFEHATHTYTDTTSNRKYFLKNYNHETDNMMMNAIVYLQARYVFLPNISTQTCVIK